MNKKINFIFKDKKIYKFFLYFLVFFVSIFSVYFFIPKFFNYTPKLIAESLKKNSNININNISSINYKLFPSPRLRLLGSYLEFEKSILIVEDAEIDIILNPLSVINYKIINYNKILIKRGFSIIKINKANQLFSYIKKNKKKINIEKNNIILLKENKKLFEISDGQVKLSSSKKNQQLNINGLFFDHKTSFILKNRFDGSTKIILKIPKLDISTEIILEGKNNFKTYEGLANIKVLNNFFQFNFVKKKNIIIKKGFLRSSMINSLFEGEVFFNPFFSFHLDIEPSTLNTESLILLLQNRYFLDDLGETKIIKKIDGSLNFKNLFDGSVIFQNTEVLFKNFRVGKNSPVFFDAKISEFGKKGKIQFNMTTNIKDKQIVTKNIKISGYVTPSNSNVSFEKIIFDKEIFTKKEINIYEKIFRDQVINSSLSNFFNEKKLKDFFKNFYK